MWSLALNSIQLGLFSGLTGALTSTAGIVSLPLVNLSDRDISITILAAGQAFANTATLIPLMTYSFKAIFNSQAPAPVKVFTGFCIAGAGLVLGVAAGTPIYALADGKKPSIVTAAIIGNLFKVANVGCLMAAGVSGKISMKGGVISAIVVTLDAILSTALVSFLLTQPEKSSNRPSHT